MDAPQDHRQIERLIDRKVERLVRMVGELDEFERDLGIESSSPVATPSPLASICSSNHWRRLAVAATLLLTTAAWMLWPRPQLVNAPREGVAPTIVKHDVPAKEVPAIEPPVHIVNMVVALYRGDDRASERCAECWCVERWSPEWGEGRNVNELEHEELVSGSIGLSCVGDPRRVIVIGLSGPAAVMPRTDEQALALSLCLMGEKEPPEGTSAQACIPKGLDYCMADWARPFP